MHDAIEKIYFEALEIDAGERAAFVRERSGGDAQLEQQVLALLEIDADGDSRLLDSPAGVDLGQVFEEARQDSTSLGSFRMGEEIGRGGMGVVHLALDTELDREVALKGLPDHLLADEERLMRFRHEAKTLAQLNHPHIASIYGMQQMEGRRYLVLEYVPGETLRHILKRGPLGIDEALAMAIQLASAIEYAHSRGVVHCDLKPANLMIRADGEMKVLDFGLARALGGQGELPPQASGTPHSPLRSSLTEPGMIVGTPGYLAPEQVRSRRPDQRSDIFSFGVLVYEMLTGAQPFPGETMTEVLAGTLKSPVDFDELPIALPPSARTMIELALHKNPNKRLQHMGDCRLLLQHATSESAGAPRETVTVESEPVVERFRITEEICRKLDRTRLDPRLIGYELQYLDNHKGSDALVLFFHAVGRDHEQWREHLRALPYRGIAPTQVGFEPNVETRLRLSIRDHLIVLREFIRAQVKEIRPTVTISTAHSAGADLAMRMIAEIEDDDPLPLDGMVPLEPNLGLATCQVTQQMAEFRDGQESELLQRLHGFADVPESLDDWIILYDYLAEIVSKFRRDIETLRDFGREIIEPFQQEGPSPFLDWYRKVAAQVPHVRCVFSETPVYHQRILRLRLGHLDDGCFGPDHKEESIHIEPGTTHLDLYHVERVSKYLQEMVQRIQDQSNSG